MGLQVEQERELEMGMQVQKEQVRNSQAMAS
jgi:hypothetical protein